MRHIYPILFLLLISFASCNDCNKACVVKKFECDCCPKVDTIVKSLPKSSITAINIFLDISGSMDGFMPNAMPGTNFQRIIPEIISKLKSEYPNQVSFFSVYDLQNKMKTEDLENARDEILHGTFSWTGNTYLPVMLDSIVKRHLKNDAVNIFISDCIYAPEKKDEKKSDLVSTDIFSVMKPFAKTFSTSIYCLSSEFRGKNTKVDSSPYYMLLTGKQENLTVIENLMMNSFKTFNQTFQEIHFGQEYSVPFYSVLPYTETSGNFIANPCASLNNAFATVQEIDLSQKPIELWIGVNLLGLPDYATQNNFLESNLIITLNGEVQKAISIFPKDKFISKIDESDKEIENECSHFVRIKITDLDEQVSTLQLSLKNQEPSWIETTNHNDIVKKEKNREKTYGLSNIILGLEQVYNMNETTMFFKPITITLIKK